MDTINNLAEAVGGPKICVTSDHIKNALLVMRDFETQSRPADKSGKPSNVALLTFDDVMLAATLLATVERSYNSPGYLCYFIGALVGAGFGDPSATEWHFESWMGVRASYKKTNRMITHAKTTTGKIHRLTA